MLIVLLLMLPLALPLIGFSSREEVYKAIPVRFGAPGREVQAIYKEPKDPDIVFLGSSLVMASIYVKPIESALSAHLGRPAYVTVLGMDWQGLDLQYFILRDMLQHHHPGLIVLNTPTPVTIANSPHYQAYRWLRYGEFSNDFTGVPLVDIAEIYGHAVLGGPRELITRIRPNLLSPDETTAEAYDAFLSKHRDFGFNGSPFVAEDEAISSEQLAKLFPPRSAVIKLAPRKPAQYPLHFLQKITALAEQNRCKLVFLHIPTPDEYGDDQITEFDWFPKRESTYSTIGAPAKALYAGMSKERFLHYYSDNHMNANGSRLFTNAIIPSLLEAYDGSQPKSSIEAAEKF